MLFDVSIAITLINRLMCTHYWSGSILLSQVYGILQPILQLEVVPSGTLR